MPKINFAEIKAPELVPAGNYLAEIVGSEETTAQSSGNTMFKLRFQIICDAEGGDEHENRVIFDNLVFAYDSRSDLPLRRIKECLVACGWPEDFDEDIEAEELIGKTLMIGVVIRQSDKINPATGEKYPPQNQVRRYSALTEEQAQMLV